MGLTSRVTTDFSFVPERYQHKTCLVIGGAPSVWEDFKEAKAIYPHADTMAVNAIGSYVPGKLTYWFSLHCYYLKVWHQVRKMLYKGDATYQAPILFSLRHTGEGVQKGDIDAIWKFEDATIECSAKNGGSLEDSGFFAMCIALVMGYRHVCLVGCPADASGHVFIPEWEYLQHDKQKIKEAWERTMVKYPEVPARVRSMSGLTRELLGAPE